MKKLILAQALTAVFLIPVQAVLASDVTGLATFSAGTPAVAAQVNGNFTAVKTAVDNNHARITTLESSSANPSITGNITLPNSTATTGNIIKNGAPFLHNLGDGNTFLGENAGNFTMTGLSNTANGTQALYKNTTGDYNTANGWTALQDNTTGSQNTAIGSSALLHNTTGNYNTASGRGALVSNTTGSGNIAIGNGAGFYLTTGDNNIAIGHQGVAAEASTTRIGSSQTRAFIAGIRGVTTGATDAIAVVVDSNGQLGTLSSSRRVKDDIADMGDTSSVLKQLRPVTFHYKSDQNPKGRSLQYGLIAEEVEKAAPGLVARSANGEIETVFYQHLTPMLLNEYQKQQRLIETQTARVAELEQERRLQTARIETLEKQAAHLAVVLGRLEQAGMLTTAGR